MSLDSNIFKTKPKVETLKSELLSEQKPEKQYLIAWKKHLENTYETLYVEHKTALAHLNKIPIEKVPDDWVAVRKEELAKRSGIGTVMTQIMNRLVDTRDRDERLALKQKYKELKTLLEDVIADKRKQK